MPLTIGFVYPSGAAVTALGIWAIQKGHNLVLYCPGYPDPAIGRTVLTDLLVHGYEKLNQAGLDNVPVKVVLEPDFSVCDALVIANMDVLPANPDVECARMCQNTCRLLKERDIKVSDSMVVLFGRNNSGLMFAKAWGETWPDQRSRIYVTCSVFQASVKVFGRDSQSRAIPVGRKNIRMVFTEEESELVKSMGVPWGTHDFSQQEAKCFIQFFLHFESKDWSSLGVLGKYPGADIPPGLLVEENQPAWLPADPTKAPVWYQDVVEAVSENSNWIDETYDQIN